MICPICGKTVTFPAVPPRKKGESPPVKAPPPSWLSKLVPKLKEILPVALEFKHWNIVLSCLVPFAIITALLIGAAVIRKHFGEEPAAPSAPVAHADAGAWEKLTEQARAEQVVQQQIAAVTRTHAALVSAQRMRDLRHTYYQGKPLDPVSAETVGRQYQADDQALASAQKVYDAARQSFESAWQNYQRLGGTVDYRGQLP